MILCTWLGFADDATDSALCASWWQAAGSALAIAAAVVLALVLHRRNLKMRQRAADDEHARALAAPLVIAEQLAQDLTRVHAVVQQAAEARPTPLPPAILLQGAIALERARRDFDALKSIVVQSLPTCAAIRSVERMMARFEEVLGLLEPLYFTALSRLPTGNIVAETAALRVPELLNDINHQLELLRQELPQRAREASARHGR